MTGAFWLTVAAADVPSADDWLSAREKVEMSRLVFPRRRSDWRAGRWAVKRALAASSAATGLADDAVEVVDTEDGAPEVWTGGHRAFVAVSISHRDGMAAAVVCGAAASAGCDIELVEPRPESFARDWLTAHEMEMVEEAAGSSREVLVTVIWSAKESVLKAVRRGLSVDTRAVDVAPSTARAGGGDWAPFEARFEGSRMNGWWRQEGRRVMTALTEPATEPPALITKEKM